jgi:hypothetical protein
MTEEVIIDKEGSQKSPESLENIGYIPPLKLDPDDYREDWAEYEFSEHQLNELLEVLWHIAQTGVLMGWGADTVQVLFAHVFQNAGQDSKKLVKLDCAETFLNGSEREIEKESDHE